MAAPAEDFCGRLSLSGLVGLLASCAVLVSNDTGPLHVAAAVGASTVGIFWVGNMINGAPLSRARHRPQVAFTLDCPVCGVDCTKGECDHRPSFVADVRAEDVRDAALALLAAAPQTGRAPL
jgi:ADP-heptose:LPS heptosyltransferase